MYINGPHRTNNGKVLMIEMTTREAIQTIRSLAEQICLCNPNSGRFEKYCECGTYFSIAVIGKPNLYNNNDIQAPN